MRQSGITVLQEVEGFQVIYTRYSDFDHARCTLADQQEFILAAEVAEASQGIFLTDGTLDFTEGSAVGSVALSGAWIVNFWSTPSVQTTVKADGLTEWVCISKNRADIPTVTDKVIMGSFVLPHGAGLVVVSGSVTAGDDVFARDEYMKADANDIALTGDAIVLLIGG